jgi:hypothetical protein
MYHSGWCKFRNLSATATIWYRPENAYDSFAAIVARAAIKVCAMYARARAGLPEQAGCNLAICPFHRSSIASTPSGLLLLYLRVTSFFRNSRTTSPRQPRW